MADATGEAKEPPLRVAFDRRIKLEFHGARITSDGGLLAYRELDDALDLTATAASTLAEGRHGKNIRHRLLGLLRQAVYGRLAAYEDVNQAARLARDPGMRAIVGREGLGRPAASTSEMGRFETDWLATEANLDVLSDLSDAWWWSARRAACRAGNRRRGTAARPSGSGPGGRGGQRPTPTFGRLREAGAGLAWAGTAWQVWRACLARQEQDGAGDQ